MFLYQLADWFFLFFHAALSLFNVTGWLFRSTRRWNLITLVLTGLSWTLLGAWYGFGYCPLTDWHWDVLNKLGVHNLPESYMKYLIDRITGLETDADLTDAITGTGFFLSVAISLVLNVRDSRKNRKTKTAT